MYVGLSALTYHGAAGGEPTSAVDYAQDVSYTITCGVAEITSRYGSGWKSKAPTFLSAEAEINLEWLGTDTAMAAFRSALLDGTLIAVGFRDAADDYGFYGDFAVEGFSAEQPLEDGMTVSISLKSAGALTEFVPTP